MQIIQKSIKVLLLLFIVLIGSHLEVYAEEVNSVKACIEHPEKCSEEQLPTEQETDNKTVDESSSVGVTIWDFLKMIIATLFVIALLYFILKFINKKSRGMKETQIIQNIGGTSLGGNRSIQMIKVGDRVLVVGVGENIQLIKEIENEDEARQIIEEYNSKIDQLMNPSDIVTKVLKRTKSAIDVQKKDNEVTSFQSIMKNQLDNIKKDRKKLLDEMEKKGSDE